MFPKTIVSKENERFWSFTVFEKSFVAKLRQMFESVKLPFYHCIMTVLELNLRKTTKIEVEKVCKTECFCLVSPDIYFSFKLHIIKNLRFNMKTVFVQDLPTLHHFLPR